MYTSWNCHHNKSRYHLLPYKVNTVLLPIFPMLYITSHDLFYSWKIVLSPLIPLATPKPYSPLATTNLFSYKLFRILLFFFLIHSPYKWNHLVCFFLWLISLSIIPSRVFHVLKNDKISFFLYMSNIPLWVLHTHTHTHTHFIHSSVTLRFITYLCYCK